MLFIPTITSFYILIALFVAGALGALVTIPLKTPRAANLIAHGLSGVGALYGAAFSLSALVAGTTLRAVHLSPFPILSYSFHIDGLSAFFMLIISLAALAASVYGYGYVGRDHAIRPGIFGFFYTLFIASLYLVVAANNGVFFLIMWECMSLTSYFLIVHEHAHAENVRAGFLYFLMTHAGTAFLTLAIILVGHAVGSYDFDTFRTLGYSIAPVIQHTALAAALLGLGIKAGIVPLHVWLPEAHPAAPSHVSALLSGVMLKMAIFMIVRFFFDFVALPGSIVWGIVILVLGAASSLLGVLYALAEHDLKRLLAYHSVENIGIILLGIGSALIFAGKGMPALAAVALVAALFHTLNHAIFKGLLFLGAGSVVQTTGTRNMEQYGGLIRILPLTAFFFLVGSLAISGLPPLNGFASEWLTFQALFFGVGTSTLYMKALFVVSISALALTSGLAAACFVKAVGVTFLARPRSERPTAPVREPLSMTLGMGILALLTLILGVFADKVFALIAGTIRVFGLNAYAAPHSMFATTQNLSASGAYTLSLPLVFTMIVVVVIAVFAIVYTFTSKRKEVIARVWACGAPVERANFIGPKSRAEITATGFARTLMVIFRRLVRTDEHISKSPVAPSVEVHLVDLWRKYGYTPLTHTVLFVTSKVRMVQSGNVNIYLLYMFVTLCVLLLVAL
jgi:hydrogenase-4 component B